VKNICVSAENTSDLRICISGAILVNFGAAQFCCVFEQKVDTGSEGIGRSSDRPPRDYPLSHFSAEQIFPNVLRN